MNHQRTQPIADQATGDSTNGSLGDQTSPIKPDQGDGMDGFETQSRDEQSINGFPKGTTIGHFSRDEKIKRLLWNIVQGTLFRFSPRRADPWRAWLLRVFGAKVGTIKLLRSTVRVEVPWNIEIGDGAQIGDRVYLYSLGPITIGDHTVISQFAHICAGTHDFERSDFPLLRVPVSIGSRCWIATESFVGPGVSVGEGVVIGARSNVIKDLPAWTICVGCPAKPIGPRKLIDISTGNQLNPS